ncbi:sensor histidine kinase [Vibrio ostreicida]|uniref:histidine kinase n=1 Tax=Vibrio ostreicida TaxID=526588 RepID=A0ABT8BY29_9VIBR|nr:HAMP domain-containing sensor histidine kinase [Vibrio ostreicida]MDN3612060.1 HAMP domain-containing sensor histidine kinase [Vibrio ostreicida]NPD08768.1 HAMP domain-containing histidine kinase [Vibrio ostreicida]
MFINVKNSLRQWYFRHLRHQVFTVISALMLLVVIAIGVIAWAATEISADSFINQRVKLLQQHFLQTSIAAGEWVKQEENFVVIYEFEDDKKPAFLKGISTLGIEEFEFSDAHTVTFISPFQQKWMHFVYFPEQDPQRVDYGEGVMAYVGYMMIVVFILGLAAAHLLSRHFSGPIDRLVHQIQYPSEHANDSAISSRQDEIGALYRTYHQSYSRIQSFLKREQQFTRFASHELRTPVNVILGATDLLTISETNEKKRQIINRIQVANKEMDNLINTFLLLGREEVGSQPKKSLQAVIDETIEQHNYLLFGRSIHLEKGLHAEIEVESYFAKVIVANLIRNAMSYTDGYVSIQLKGRRLTIENDVREHGEQGFGHGDEIISAVCKSANWRYHLSVTSNKAMVVVYF